MAAAPTVATVTPAIWGFVRTGFAAAAGTATTEDEVAAATELVEDFDIVSVVGVMTVVGVVYSPTPPDAAFVVWVQSEQDVELSEVVGDPVTVAIVVVNTVLVLNATLDALETIEPKLKFEETLLLLVGVTLTSPVADVTIVEVAVSVECVFGLAPRTPAQIS